MRLNSNVIEELLPLSKSLPFFLVNFSILFLQRPKFAYEVLFKQLAFSERDVNVSLEPHNTDIQEQSNVSNRYKGDNPSSHIGNNNFALEIKLSKFKNQHHNSNKRDSNNIKCMDNIRINWICSPESKIEIRLIFQQVHQIQNIDSKQSPQLPPRVPIAGYKGKGLEEVVEVLHKGGMEFGGGEEGQEGQGGEGVRVGQAVKGNLCVAVREMECCIM